MSAVLAIGVVLLGLGVAAIGVVGLVLVFDDDRRREILHQLGHETGRAFRVGRVGDGAAQMIGRRDVVRHVCDSPYFAERVVEAVRNARRRSAPVREDKAGGL